MNNYRLTVHVENAERKTIETGKKIKGPSKSIKNIKK